MGLDLTMLRTPDALSKSAPAALRESPGYFRGVPYETLDAAGILDFDARPLRHPHWPPGGLKKKRAEALRSLFEPAADDDSVASIEELRPTPAELHAMQGYLAGYARTRAVRSRKRGQVPELKFASNDGWIVTPEECLNIACRLRLHLRTHAPAGDDDLDFVEEFAAFNEIAARYGGYEVW